MEKELYNEMSLNLEIIGKEMDLFKKDIFLFGHCNATLELIDLLESKALHVKAILDNSDLKKGLVYKGVRVIPPFQIKEYMKGSDESSIVLIASRFYASMLKQLRLLGYKGQVRKVIDYNTYAEYSISEETIVRMKKRESYGEELLKSLSEKYPGYFKTFCPFNALGDIYFMASYWEAFAQKRRIENVVFCVSGDALSDVIHLFGNYAVEVYKQKELDAMIQAVLYTHDLNSFIAHQDRPYIINLSKALYLKKIPLEEIYCCGVYGLPRGTVATKPKNLILNKEINIDSEQILKQDSKINSKVKIDLASIKEGKSIIFSPYAKSVPAINCKIWNNAIKYFAGIGYECYTNVIGDELALEGTKAISPSILEIGPLVERAGTFIGIRSGLCDVIRETKAKKIALYPDYNYCDTKWKAIDMYWIRQFDYNLLAEEDIKWEIL